MGVRNLSALSLMERTRTQWCRHLLSCQLWNQDWQLSKVTGQMIILKILTLDLKMSNTYIFSVLVKLQIQPVFWVSQRDYAFQMFPMSARLRISQRKTSKTILKMRLCLTLDRNPSLTNISIVVKVETLKLERKLRWKLNMREKLHCHTRKVPTKLFSITKHLERSFRRKIVFSARYVIRISFRPKSI